MNLSPVGAHLLDASAIVIMLRRGFVASHEALVPFPALGEVYAGAFRSTRPELEFLKIEKALAPAAIVHSSMETAYQYGRIMAHLQRVGQVLPINDVWIAAQALELDLPLLSDDAHFRRVPGLRLLPAC